MRTLYHPHTYAHRVRACKSSRRTRVHAIHAHVRTHGISSRVPASERANERWRAGASREGQGRWGRHTGDVILTKGRNNIGVDLLKSRLFLARVPPNALPFWYFERPSRKRVDFSTEPLTDESLIKKKKKRRVRRSRTTATQCRLGIYRLPETY